jgi:endonuclease/exonuclease/phosphatase family metal-dependent hydrolase
VNKLEQRGVLHCEVQPLGWEKPVVILCAHLNLFERDRIKQYEAISQYMRNEIDDDQPLILAGDFNDWKRMSCDRLASNLGMVEAFRHCHGKLSPTFPAKLPVLSLDRIYVRNLKVKDAWVHTGKPWSTLSDHLPISAEFTLV